MRAMKVVALLLVLAGAGTLIYGHFTYTDQTHAATVGSLDISVKERHIVRIPTAVSIIALVVGTVMLFSGKVEA